MRSACAAAELRSGVDNDACVANVRLILQFSSPLRAHRIFNFNLQIHWFSLFNSFMMVVFLCGLVALILMRTLKVRAVSNRN